MLRNFAAWFLIGLLGLFGADRYLDRQEKLAETAPSADESGPVHSQDDGTGFPPP